MRVLLIATNRLTAPYPVYPLGIDHVAASLGPEHEVEILDLCPPDPQLTLAETIRRFGPEVVGLSIRNVDTSDATGLVSFLGEQQELVSEVRAVTDAPIVLGGSGFTLHAADLLVRLGADLGVLGEGERLPLLLDALARGEDPGGLPWVVTPQLPAGQPAPWDGPVRRLPAERMPGLTFYLDRGGILSLQTKRGCPHRCIYCSYPTIEGHELRLFDPAEVGQVARRLQDAGASFLFVADASFNCHPQHNLAVARALQRAGVTVPWGAFFSPSKIPDGYFASLAEAGLTHAEFGTEALSQRMLDAYRKPFAVPDVQEAHEAAVAAGLQVAHYFLLGGPGEDPDTVNETLGNADRLRRTALFFFCGVRLYPGTELYALALQQGQIHVGDSLLEPVFYHPPSLGDLDLEEHVTRHARGRINWVVGAMSDYSARLYPRLHARGLKGPLWELLVR